VSSILNALRKLETEIPQAIRKQTWPKTVTDAVGGRGKKRTLYRLRAVPLLLSIAALTFAGGYFHKQLLQLYKNINPAAGVHAVVNEPESKPVAVKTNPSVKLQVSKQPADVRKKRPASRSRTTVSSSPPENSTRKPALPQKRPTRVASRNNTLTRPQPTIPAASERTVRSLPASPTERIPAARRTGIQPRRSLGAKTAENTQWMLQAIAWSEMPNERLVVINGQVLREGDSYEGLTVTRIGKDEVTIREGRQQTILEFRLK